MKPTKEQFEAAVKQHGGSVIFVKVFINKNYNMPNVPLIESDMLNALDSMILPMNICKERMQQVMKVSIRYDMMNITSEIKRYNDHGAPENTPESFPRDKMQVKCKGFLIIGQINSKFVDAIALYTEELNIVNPSAFAVKCTVLNINEY